jgi:rod shape determining protein RodA
MLVFFPLSWFIMKPYQRVRLISFINPHLDKQGTAYNMIQSIIAIGSGGFLGKGLGLGTQAKLFFLPENYTDFAFASFIEQFGLLGGLILLTLFLILFYFLVKKIYNFTHFNYPQVAVDFYYTLGFLVMIFSQVVINMGMNLGLLPVTGITLPLISYGGSSLASFMLGLALLP